MSFYPISTGGIGFDSKNKVINGAMQISQENGTTAGTGTTRYPVDQFFTSYVGSQVIESQQVTSASFEDFIYSTKLTVNNPDASLAATDYTALVLRIEGYNVAPLGFGKSWAKTITLSFCVQSSLTGTYCVAFRNSALDRVYIAEYTIDSANTPEYKTITIPADTAGTWLYDNGIGLRLAWCLGTGTTYQTTAGSWQIGDFIGTSNQVNWAATTNNTFYLTGVQLEEGTIATEFEHRDFQSELAKCQRYYLKYKGQLDFNFSSYTSGSVASWQIAFPVEMRTTPAVTTVIPNFAYTTATGFAATATNSKCARITLASTAATTNATGTFPDNSTDYISFSARL